MAISRSMRNALRQGREDLLRGFSHRRGFNGAGVAYRVRDGETTDEPVVVAFVTKKRPVGLLLEEDVLPRQVGVGNRNYGVDVYQAGPFSLGGDPEFEPPGPTITERFRPLLQGAQISNPATSAYGTLGAIVRDVTDGAPAILSNNHVLVANNASSSIGNEIRQPFSTSANDVVANVTRFKPFTFGPARPNLVDVAIARLTPAAAKELSDQVAGARMGPFTVDNPCVGLYFAADPFNLYGVICKIDTALDEVGANLLTPEAIAVPGPADIGKPLEKAGARTGYTSSRIHAVDVKFPVFMEISGGTRVAWFDDVIGIRQFGWPGDSGSGVRLGGDGETRLGIDLGVFSCLATDSVASMYDLPLQNDVPLADRIRDGFMARSYTGNFLVQLFYLNNNVILSRTEGVEASPSEKAGAASMYQKYRDFVYAAVDAPDRPGLVVTREHIDDAALGLASLQTRMTAEETTATNQIFNSLVRRTEGMTHQQLIAFMDRDDVFDAVWDAVAAVPTVQALGQLRPLWRGPR
ncbi:hypothetical protein [Amycolatopsis sp.]|uniref:hypothetical protein n=1 Tax=Amycolatopsis sp. TaxID=37632 RepID=UPI002D7E9FDB|nr:hypothetical protein [Amycolatopsis sp.]HET6708961.1 hypothetical protein [Amycolatopsis sp.]